MTQFLKIIPAIALVFGVGITADAQTPSLSADDTVSYVNETLHKYPTLEFIASGCPGDEQVLAISSDRRSLIITQVFSKPGQGSCGDLQTLTVPIFSLNRNGIGDWSKQDQHSAFLLECVNGIDCFSRKSEAHTFPSAENNWSLRLTAPDEVSNRLTKSIRHLLDTLLTEATARMDANDAFAKRRR